MGTFAGLLSYWTDFLDAVEVGVSDVGIFASKMESAAIAVIGIGNPVGKAIATINTDIQQAVAALHTVVATDPGTYAGPLVLTEKMLLDIWGTVEEAVGTFLPSAGTTGQKIDAVLAEVLPIVIQLGLSVVPGGGILSLGAPTLTRMVMLVLSDLGL